MAHPDAVCSLLPIPHLGPHLCTPPSRPSFRGRFKGTWERCADHPDGPGAPRSQHQAPRSPPGHCGRGRTASRGGEPEVRGGAPGNPSPSEPGGAGGRGQAGGARGGSRGARGAGGRGGGRRGRTVREAPPPAPGARSSPPLSPLTLPLASGRLPGCVHREPGSPAHGALATARPPGGRHRLESRTPTGTLEERTRERGAAAVTPRGDPGGAGREPLGSAGPDGAATPCARWAGPRGGQP